MSKSMCLVLGVVVTAALCAAPATWADEIGAIQSAISAKGARWTAGETSVSGLDFDGKLMRLGVLPPRPMPAETGPSARVLSAAALPVKLDWRANGGNFVTPVKDQGECESAWAFSVAGALESYSLIKNNTPGQNLDLAEQILISCCPECSEWEGGCQKGWTYVAAEFARGKGAPAESCYPYTETDGTCADACPNWQASAVKAADWNWVTAPNKRSDIEALKTALNTYGPLSVTMVTYYDFFFYRKGVYSRTSNQLMGHHAVLLIGYDDVEKLFIAKNSWGAGWGEAGYFRLAYDTVTDCQGDVDDPANNPGVCLGYHTIAFSPSAFAGKLTSVSGASYSGLELGVESIVSGFGSGLATATQAASTLPLPTSLAGTTVQVTDSQEVSKLAGLFYVSPGQVNYQIPAGMTPGVVSVRVSSGDGKVSTGPAQLAEWWEGSKQNPWVAPGLFSANADGQGVAAADALRIKADGTQSYEPVSVYDSVQKKYVSVPIDLGPATDRVYLLLYGTGFRFLKQANNATAAIGGQPAPVTYAGAQGTFVGLDQANILLPRALTGKGEVEVVLTVEGKPANTVRINVK